MLVLFLLLISPRKKLDIYHRSLYLLFLSLFLFVSLNYLPLFSCFFLQTQFVILLVYIIYSLKTNCVVDFFPLVFLYMHLIFLVSLFILFSNFYVQSYLKKNKASRSNREKKVD